jgi:prepilin-type N-terminal cleavage/methylation domain-containing protein
MVSRAMPYLLPPARRRGFTLIELLVVLAIVGLLASIATPRYLRSLEVARERALRTSLTTMRDAIDQFAADKGRWPRTLQELAEARYMREVPEDPLTGRRDSWLALAAQGAPGESATGAGLAGSGGGIGDVRSGAGGRARDGSLYADW